jgi:hypothetical protein
LECCSAHHDNCIKWIDCRLIVEVDFMIAVFKESVL